MAFFTNTHKVKTEAFTQERVIELIQTITKPKLRAYATILYWLACRAGEPLPYIHYEYKYKKDNQTQQLIRDEKGNPILESKTFKYASQGIEIDSIILEPSFIKFNKIPVFKTKEIDYKEGFIPQKNNPLFVDLCAFIQERKTLREELKAQGNPRMFYLFEPQNLTEKDTLNLYWRMQKALIKELKSKEPNFKIHSLRVSRATQAGDASGDPFYVQSITGHVSIEQASQYTKSRNFKDKFQKYEGLSNE